MSGYEVLRTETAEWRKPKLVEGDIEIFSEPGRVIRYNEHTAVDYASHWFVLTKAQFGGYSLYVKHGGGEERLNLRHKMREILPGLHAMTSDQRFLLFWTLKDIDHEAAREARESEAAKYRAAFVDGRLKKRKLPARGVVKVWIEPAEVKSS